MYFRTINFSTNLERIGVTDIGRRSVKLHVNYISHYVIRSVSRTLSYRLNDVTVSNCRGNSLDHVLYLAISGVIIVTSHTTFA